MAEQSKQAQPSIALDTKDSRPVAARVVLPEGVDAETLSVRLLASLARERGVEMTAAAEQVLAQIIARYRGEPKALSEVFLRATAPEHGEHGFIEWLPGFNPEKPDENEHNPGEERVDFYAHSSFVKVHKEDHIATIHLPTEGTDGRDVTGRTIPANPGRAFSATRPGCSTSRCWCCESRGGSGTSPSSAGCSPPPGWTPRKPWRATTRTAFSRRWAIRS